MFGTAGISKALYRSFCLALLAQCMGVLVAICLLAVTTRFAQTLVQFAKPQVSNTLTHSWHSRMSWPENLRPGTPWLGFAPRRTETSLIAGAGKVLTQNLLLPLL